jgi:hypothetical protein
VIDGIELVGIVTYTDVLQEHASRSDIPTDTDFFSDPV